MAKRVNTKFLVIFTAVVAAMGVASFVATVALRKNAAAYVREGDAKMARGDYTGARNAYGLARAKERTNLEALTKLGDAYDALAAADAENMLLARQVWNEAVTLDPRYVPALRRLADSYWDQAKAAPYANEIHRLVGESHARLLDALPPDAPEAERATVAARMHLGTVNPWLRMNAVVDRKKVEEGVAALAKLAGKDPANADIPAAVAQAYVKWAGEAAAAGRDDERAKLLARAVDQMRDALRGQERNAAMQLAAFQLDYATLPLRRDEADRKATQAAAAAALAAAVAAVKPADDVYPDVMMTAAAKAAQDGRADETARIYQEMLAKRPDDPRVRLVAARAIAAADRSKRGQAIELLSKPVVPAAGDRGARALRARDWEVRLLIELIGLRMDEYQDAPDAARRDAVARAIDQDFLRLQTMMPADAIPYLRLKARHQQILGDVTAAIQSYAKAVQLSGTPNSNDDYDLMSELARAYLQARPPQTGAAERLLEPIAKKFPGHVPTRLLLAGIALDRNDLEAARSHAEDLRRYAPDNPQALNLRAVVLARSGADAATVDAFLAAMPERSRDQRLLKAQVAGGAFGRNADASRILAANVADDPKDLASLAALVNSLLAEKRYDDARQAVAAAAAKAPPGDPSLRKAVADLDALLKQQDLAPAERYDAAVARVNEEQKDNPLALAIALGDLARRYNKPDDAERQYRAAERADGNDLSVAGRMYELLMDRRRYDDAKPYLQKLVKANADGRDGLALESRYALLTKDVDGAARRAQALTVRWPEFGESWLLLAQAQQAGGKYNEAIGNYAAAQQRQGKSRDAIKGTIECEYALGRPADARAAIADARTLFPNDPLFRELELGHEVTYGDPERAIPAREQGVKDAPDDKPRLLVLVEAYGRAALVKYANDPAKRQQYLAKARAATAAAAKRWPDDPKIVGVFADVLVATGELAEGEKVLAAYAASPAGGAGHQAQLMLANYYARVGRPDDAARAMRAALARSNGDPEVRRLLVAMLSQQKKFDDALSVLRDAPGGDPVAVRQRIEVLLAAGRRPEAEQAIRSAMGEHPQMAGELRVLLAALFIDGGRFDEASAELDRALSADANDATALYYRATTKLRRPQPDVPGALADLQKVRQIAPNNVPARVLTADALNASGARQQAVGELEEALRLAPLNAALRRRLVDAYADRRQYGEVLRLTSDAEATPGIDQDPSWPLAASRALAQQDPPDYPGALAALDRAVRRLPEGNVDALREKLGLLHRAGRDDEVVRTADGLLKAGRHDWWIYQHRGMAKGAMKDLNGALADFDRALAEADKAGGDAAAAESVVQSMAAELGAERALDRARARAGTDLRWKAVAASLYQAMSDWTNAVREADEAMAALDAPPPAGGRPVDPQLRLTVLRTAASTYHFAKPRPLFDKARDAYLKLIAAQPGDFFSLNNLAVLIAEEATPPDPKGAREYSEKAYNLVRGTQPMVTRVVDTHAWILAQTGSVDEALPLLRSVVDNDPFVEARYHLGETFLMKKRAQEAEQQLSAAHEQLTLAKKQDQPVDAKLLRKVEEALARAKAMQNEAKAQ